MAWLVVVGKTNLAGVALKIRLVSGGRLRIDARRFWGQLCDSSISHHWTKYQVQLLD